MDQVPEMEISTTSQVRPRNMDAKLRFAFIVNVGQLRWSQFLPGEAANS